MRRFLPLVPLLLLSHHAGAQTASISEIGIQSFYSVGSVPTRVRVQVSNPGPQPVTLNLVLSVTDKDVRSGRVDTFNSSLALQAAEVRVLDLPLPLFAGNPVVTLDATAAEGRLVSHQTKILQRPEGNSLVVLLCAEDKTCNEVLGTIGASGTDEQKTRKTRDYTFLVVKDLPEQWWIYGPAHSVILARPASGLSVRQREALEGYCRMRGQIATVDSLVGTGFFDDYHASVGLRADVGTGALYRFHDASELASFLDRSVGDLRDGEEPKIFRERAVLERYMGRNALELATTFEFPTLRWLIVWLTIYIVVVGAVNFFILTRLDRRELAWITVPATALIFALMLYLLSAAKRPSNIGVDEIATYYMDDQNQRAAAYYDLRVSAPHQQDLSLLVPGDAVWNGADRLINTVGTFSIFDRTSSNPAAGWSIELLPERRFAIPLSQWSYQDLSFSGMTTLPGNLKSLPGGQVGNETGLSFRQAVFLADGRIYDLGSVAAGAIFTARKGAWENAEAVRTKWVDQWRRNDSRFDRNSHEDIRQFLATQGSASYPVFAGLAEAPVLGASLPGQNFTHRQYIVVVIGMRGAP